MKFTIFASFSAGDPKNCFYPNQKIITNKEELIEAVANDHVCASFKSSRRSVDNFVAADCLVMDCDNDHSDNPSEWVSPEKLESLLPDVSYAVATSRSNMKQKGGKSARPRFHVYFPIETMSDAEEYKKLKAAIQSRFYFFDANAVDAARFIYGHKPDAVIWHEGWVSIDSVFPAETRSIDEGNRNTKLSHFAGKLVVRYGATEKAHEIFLEEAQKCEPPLADAELKSIWKSARRFAGKVAKQDGYIPPDQYNDNASQSTEPVQWETPLPFNEMQPAPFPVDALPRAVRPYVEAVSEATQTPVDMAATVALAVIAACIRGKYRIRAKADWEEPLNIYALIVAEPSERKSPVTQLMMKSVYRYEAEYNKRHQVSQEMSFSKKRALEKRKREVEDRLSKKKAEDGELQAIVSELAEFKEEKPLRVFTDDVTPEKLVSILAENSGAGAVISSEGGIFDQLAGGMYSKAVNIDVFLKGYSGDTIRIDRIGRNSESVDRPALTVLLTVQPSVLAGLMQNDTFRGRGLTARFLYAMPQTHVGSRRFDTEKIPFEAARDYESLIGSLLDEDGNPSADNPGVITLSPDAVETLKAFSEELEKKILNDYAEFSDWAGKLCGSVVRIAGLLARADSSIGYGFLQEDEAPVVSGETMKRAIAIGEYYTEHAKAAYLLMGADPVVKQCECVLKAVVKKGISETSKRDIMRMCRSFKKADDLQPVLDRLCDYGYFALKTENAKSGRGRPASPTYLVNPAVFNK